MTENRDKSIVTDDVKRSGLRLKKARLMAGFTRQALEDKYGISVNTLQAWEQAKAPLTVKGAIRVLEALNDSGIDCSLEWLLHGIGLAPRLNDAGLIEDVNILNKVQRNKGSSSSLNWDDETAILHEIEFFKTCNLNSLVMIVTDDGMSPIYYIGDYVGGKRNWSDNFDKYIGQHCIVETSDGVTLLRRLELGKLPGLYSLCCINPYTTAASSVLYNVKIVCIAPIIWHRKKDR